MIADQGYTDMSDYGWEYLTLEELHRILRATLQYACPSDAPFIQDLTAEIAGRIAQAFQEQTSDE